jgi:hypothetical protein
MGRLDTDPIYLQNTTSASPVYVPQYVSIFLLPVADHLTQLDLL